MTTDAEPSDVLLGQTLAGQFHVLKRLGAGGMGAVYLAEQSDMGRRVVIKVMHPELTVGNPQAVERFKREARAVAALNHPHIVQVFVFGQAEDGRMYLAMEFIEGRDLAGEIMRAPLSQGRALKVLDQVAAALVEAHARGVVHRDLKPENIMLANRHGNPDWVKVLDFGIAKVGAQGDGKDAPALTQQGAIFGTPRYMAPEQITGGVVDARTDLYALGIILYEMLTGDHPFRATSALDFLMKHVQEAVVAPSVVRPELGIHPKIDEILERLLAKKQGDRFQSAAELQRELRVAIGLLGEPLSHTLSISASAIQEAVQESARASTITHAPGVIRKKSNNTWMWVVLGLLIVAGGFGAAVLALGGKPAVSPLAAVAGKPAVSPLAAVAGKPAVSPLAAVAGKPAGSPEPVALLTPPPEPPTPTVPPPEPTTPDTIQAASVDTVLPDTALADVQIVRAGSPIEGFPVPEGTTLLGNEPLQLRLESTLAGAVLVDFYQSELAGRVKAIPAGFEVTDPTSPWSSIYFSNNADRTAITVSRRAAVHLEEVAAPEEVIDEPVVPAEVLADLPKLPPKTTRKPPIVVHKPTTGPLPTPVQPNPDKPGRIFRDQGSSPTTPTTAPPATNPKVTKPPRTWGGPKPKPGTP